MDAGLFAGGGRGSVRPQVGQFKGVVVGLGGGGQRRHGVLISVGPQVLQIRPRRKAGTLRIVLPESGPGGGAPKTLRPIVPWESDRQHLILQCWGSVTQMGAKAKRDLHRVARRCVLGHSMPLKPAWGKQPPEIQDSLWQCTWGLRPRGIRLIASQQGAQSVKPRLHRIGARRPEGPKVQFKPTTIAELVDDQGLALPL